jgi:hypothetical protein
MWKTTKNSSNCFLKALEEYRNTKTKLFENQIINVRTLGRGNHKNTFEYMSDFPIFVLHIFLLLIKLFIFLELQKNWALDNLKHKNTLKNKIK